MNTVCINPTTYLLPWSPGKVSGNLRHPKWNLRRFLKYSGFWSKKLPFKVISLIPYNHKIIGLPFPLILSSIPKGQNCCIRMNIVLQSDDLGASAITLLEMFVKLHKGSFGTTQESHSCQFMPASVVWFCLVLVFVGMISQKYLPKNIGTQFIKRNL